MNDKSNGAGPPIPSPFEALAQMMVNIGTARNNREQLARLGGAQQLLRAIEQGFTLQAQQTAYMRNVLLQATGGELRELKMNVEGDPVGYKFEDATGKPVLVVDADQGLVLWTPEHTAPIVVTVKLKDGTEKVITVAHDQPPPEDDDSDEDTPTDDPETCEHTLVNLDGSCASCGASDKPGEPLRVPVGDVDVTDESIGGPEAPEQGSTVGPGNE